MKSQNLLKSKMLAILLTAFFAAGTAIDTQAQETTINYSGTHWAPDNLVLNECYDGNTLIKVSVEVKKVLGSQNHIIDEYQLHVVSNDGSVSGYINIEYKFSDNEPDYHYLGYSRSFEGQTIYWHAQLVGLPGEINAHDVDFANDIVTAYWEFSKDIGDVDFEFEHLEFEEEIEWDIQFPISENNPYPNITSGLGLPNIENISIAPSDNCEPEIDFEWTWTANDIKSVRLVVSKVGVISTTDVTITSGATSGTVPLPDATWYDVPLKAQIIGSANPCGVVRTAEVFFTYSAAYAPPTGLSAVQTVTNIVQVNWTAPTSGAPDKYIIERNSAGGQSTFEVNGTETQYIDNSAAMCEVYYYKVRAMGACPEDGVLSTEEAGVRMYPYDIGGAFNSAKRLICSKGYFNDKIKLTWDYDFQNAIEFLKIYRRVYDSGDAFQLIATLDPTTTYDDETAEAGIYYQYAIKGGVDCDGIQFLTNYNDAYVYNKDIGFRVPEATVSGSVTFENGTAVEGVKIIAESEESFTSKSLYFPNDDSYIEILDDDSFDKFNFDTAFTFQAWIKPTNNENRQIFIKGTQYRLWIQPGEARFTANGQNLYLNFDVKPDTFMNITAIRTADSLKLFVFYDRLHFYKSSVEFTGNTPENTDPLVFGEFGFGNAFTGYMDEIRLWHRALSDDEVLSKGQVYIAGNSSGLSLYIKGNELFNNQVFDISRSSSGFNENHGNCFNGVSLSEEIPFLAQISVGGITDKNGNYLITGIPYTLGSVYTFTPVFEVHEFAPHSRSRFIGPGSNNHNGVDFIDIAAFKIQGNVVYKDTYFPVKDVQLYVDGRAQVLENGTPVTTDNMGNYEIYVPIGWHNISVGKSGHSFESGGRFPVTGNWNFQEPFSALNFTDTTLVKVIGKVTGGPIQAEKPTGLGKTLNNIGFAEITMTTEKEYDLATGTSTGTWLNQSYKDDNFINDGTTDFLINGLNPKSIKIYPDHATGEFFAYLLPEKYYMTAASAGIYTFAENDLLSLDLTTAVLQHKTEIDSVITDLMITPTGDTTFIYRIDSVQYNYKANLIYREIPSIDVTKHDGEQVFWETEITAKDGQIIQITEANGTPLTDYPVFKQRGIYKLKIAVFEQYINSDNGNAVDIVPVKDGRVEIQNFLSLNKNKEVFQIDQNGEVKYEFKGGMPNIAENGDESYTKTMTILAKTGTNGVINTPWLFNGEVFTGYVVGGMPSGNNFITKGPDEVKMILRDPPGSNSYAYYSEGMSVSETSTWECSNEFLQNNGLTVDFGSRVVTWAGVGAGTIMETETIADLTVGIDLTETIVANGVSSTTTTLTQTWQTSSDENFVGTGGDLYIGLSSNIVYGVNTNIDLMPIDHGEGHVGGTIVGASNSYRIGKDFGIRMDPEFSTAFQYSQNHIELYLIPNLKMLRNSFLLRIGSNYTSVLSPDDPQFGRANETGVAVSGVGYVGGDSYNFFLPAGWNMDSLYVDSVAMFNQQIDGWIEVMARNEREKLQSELQQNLSFDAGASYESSATYSGTEETTTAFSFTVSPYMSSLVGFEALGLGMEVQIERRFTNQTTFADGSSETNETTFGYVLQDGNAGDYISVDVKKPKTQTGPVFRTRGGQTMCPYEGEDLTNYYQENTPLNEATMQREKPQLLCESPIAFDVPEDQPAIFNIKVSNISETNDAQWFLLTIDHASNECGTFISMDGADMGSGVLMMVPANTTINKSIYFEKMQPDVYDCENIGIILGSACQNDPTDFQADIADTLKLTAYWQPVCSNVDMASPSDLWVVNTNGDTTLNVGVTNYDLSNALFETVALKVKSASTSNWGAPKMTFYVNEDDYNAANEPKLFIDGQASINYILDLVDMQDRNYDIKLQTTCADGTVNDSEIAHGIKDVKRPKLFGSPQPADGILSPNDEIMITFDEDIYPGGLTPYNFSVRGVLNGNELKHESCLYFDGVDDYASAVSGVNLDNKSWTIEFWARCGDLDGGVIFAQNGVEIGFNYVNQFYLKTGSQTITSNQTFTDLETWYHFAVTYNYEARVFNMYINDVIERESVPQTSAFEGNGKMYVGKSPASAFPFNGFVHELRIWEKALGFGTVYAQMYQQLVGNEIGLGGYWTMAEAQGDVAEDKSRNHHLILFDAEWRVFPTGYARTFDYESYVSINTGSSVVITPQMDFTLELYFKGEMQGNTVLFSNGSGDGTDYTPPYNYIWLTGFNPSGELYVKNNGVYIVVPEEDFLDDKWHHLAIVCNRQANTSIFVDGELKSYEQSSLLGGFAGADMTIGARRHEVPGTISYDKYFYGSIDEVRIWNLAKTAKQIKLDMNSKLVGDEMGLLAYYPFDKYNALGIGLDPTLEDISGLAPDAIAIAGGTSNIDVPNIKDARPVQQLAFDWAVNEDQIIINVNEQPSAIEKCILEFTVDRVEDLRENRMASPVTWTAYIKQNAVIWNDFELNFNKEVYTEMSFDADILNIGGTEQSYTITGLPSWLTCSEPTGSLAPDSYKTLTFTVNPVVNIGDYSLSVFLTSDFGYAEKLNINLNVFEEKPEWTVDENDYQYSMSVIGQLKIDGVFSTNKNDMVAAFVNGECRGLANSEYVEEYDMFEVFLNIYSNQQSGEEVTFKMWNASEGYVHVNVTPILSYMYNEVIGMPSNPQVIESYNSYNVYENLEKGWNWISFNLQNANMEDVNGIMSSVSATDGDQIKGQTEYASYSSAYGWDGSLIDNGGFDNASMYMLKLASGDILEYSGSKLKPDEIEIPLATGWNWISYTPNSNMTVDDAFGNYQPQNGDIVKSQFEFAMYDTGLGWLGSLTYMVTGKGYMFKTTNANGNLTYPIASLYKSEIKGNGYEPVTVSGWNLNEYAYQFNMSVVSQLQLAANQTISENHAIGAFVGDECRGICRAIPIGTQDFYYLTVYSNAPENIDFKLIDLDNGLIYNINENIAFVPNNIVGNHSAEFTMTLGNEVTQVENINQTPSYSVSSYPNPVSDKLHITYSVPENADVLIEIYDVLGKRVATVANGIQTGGKHEIEFSTSNICSGIYVLKMTAAEHIENLNFVKQ